MATIKSYSPENQPTETEKEEIANFLFKHLEQYGDPKEQILAAMDYSLGQTEQAAGGQIFSIYHQGQLAGATVLNRTGMTGYIPENILVYIAVDAQFRGKGLGKQLMQAAIEQTPGDIALHVEKDNPAKHLYEKLGFTNPYLEMRLKK